MVGRLQMVAVGNMVIPTGLSVRTLGSRWLKVCSLVRSESHQPLTLEQLYAALPGIAVPDLPQVLTQLTQVRNNLGQTEDSGGGNAVAVVDLLIGDVFARVGSLDHAFTSWERALERGLPTLGMKVGGHTIPRLVNHRRIAHAHCPGPHRKPRVLLFGSFPEACMVSAETVHVVADPTAERPQWNADLSQIAYDWRRSSMDDIMAQAPAGWRPDYLVVANVDGTPLPSGVENMEEPKIAWAGDFINMFDAVAECARIFDLLVVDQQRDVEFAKAYGFPNVASVLMQAQQTTIPHALGIPAYAEREIDVAFLGLLDTFPIYANRRELLRKLDTLSDRYEIQILDNIVDIVEMHRLLGNAKIGVNVNAEFRGRWAQHSYSGACPRRIFEITSMGALCLTPTSTTHIHEHFEVGKEVACFTPDDFEQQLIHYLDHPDDAEEMAGAGRHRTSHEHTIVHRFADLLRLAAATRSRPRSSGSSEAIVKQQYYLTGHAHVRPPSAPHPDPPSAAVHNIAACTSTTSSATTRAAQYRLARTQDPGNVVYCLNSMCHAAERKDWEGALSLATAIRSATDDPIPPSALEGWMRRELYLGCVPTAPWWRMDLRFEVANALYVDPSRGEEFAEYMRRHLQVAVTDYQGCFAFVLGRGDDAVTYWSQAYSLDPSDEYVLARMAEYWASLGEYEEAETWCARTERIRPFNAHNAVIMARIHEHRGCADAADATYMSLGYRRIGSREEALQWVAENPSTLPT